MDHEFVKVSTSAKLVELFLWQVNLVELFVLLFQFLLLCGHNLNLFLQLIVHQLMQLLPKVKFLTRV